jgi:hypothetical protein
MAIYPVVKQQEREADPHLQFRCLGYRIYTFIPTFFFMA